MNTILKRVISLLLCVVMTVGYMPVNAFATESGETVTAETTEVTAEQTEAASEETEAPSESTESLAELSEVTDDSDEEEEETEKESEKEEKESEKESEKEEKETEKESKKEEKEAEKEAKKEEKEAEKEAKKEEKEAEKETEPSTEPSTEATEPSTEATEPSTEPTSENPLMTLEIEDEADPVAAALEVRAGVEVSSTALEKAQAYIDALTINNTSNDPATVVGNFGTHFTWDNEKRESSKSYLFDWSYYNGVVFEGLEYLYEVTGKTVYKDYVEEYMSSMITADGTWASCTNNTSKQAAGYNSTHGADCYKTASLLLDLYEMTEDERYLTMAATLYADLDAAAKSYSLSNAGNNYRHTWASDPSPDLWLDGLYMILPFRAEYAEHIGDTEELNLIVDRMQWVSDNMYNKEKGLFYHAADSANSNSGSYWLRAIGWYAAAIVDVMDSMSGENLETMKTQLKKLVDGMLLVQNSTNGMWLNNMALSESSTNPYETSGTALVCYAVMKAVNEGWLDKSYADMAVLAFNGICSEKLSGTTLKDICFKGAPGSGNSTFYDNEGKGVGPFIMLYAEILKYTGVKPEQPEQPTEPSEPTEPEVVTKEDTATGVTVAAPGITGLTVSKIEETAQVEQIQQKVAQVLKTENLVMLDIAVDDFVPGSTATVVVPVPAGMDVNKFGVFYVPEEGEIQQMPGEPVDETHYKFTTTHFSPYIGGEILEDNNDSGEGSIGSINGGITATVSGTKATAVSTGSYYVIQNNRVAGTDQLGGYMSDEIYTTNTNNRLNLQDEIEHYWYIVRVIDGYTIQYGGPDGPYLTIGSATSGLSEEANTVTMSYSGTRWRISDNDYYLNNFNDEPYAGGWQNNSAAEDAGSQWNLYPVTMSSYEYVLDTDGMDPGAKYIIVGSDNDIALTRSDNDVGNRDVTVNGNQVTVSGDVAEAEFYFTEQGTESGSTVYLLTQNGTNTIYHYGGNMYYGTDNKGYWHVVNEGNGEYRVYDIDNGNSWHLNYGYVWGQSENHSNLETTNRFAVAVSTPWKTVRLYKKVVPTDVTVNFAISPETITLAVGEIKEIAYQITMGNGETVTECEIDWADSGEGYVTVDDYGVVEGLVGDTAGSRTTVTATLKSVNGKQLNEPITLTCNITVLSQDAVEKPDFKPEDIPAYPNEGAVQLSKVIGDAEYFQKLGVAEVKLAASGIPAKTYVDAVLTIDISNSMAWGVGSATDNFERNKLHEVMGSIDDFAEILLKENEDGTPSGNTITIVFFAGKDNEHWGGTSSDQAKFMDSVMIAGLRLNDLEDIKTITSGTYFTGKNAEYELKITTLDANGRKVEIEGQNRGDTQYDYAFWQTEQAVNSILDANANSETNREVHVLFMTDGCPTNFNNAYYNSGGIGNYLLPGSTTEKYYAEKNYKGTNNNGGTGWIAWLQESIAQNGGNIYAKSLYEKVDGLYAVGFDMANGAFSGSDNWPKTAEREAAFIEIVGSIVGRRIPVTNATDTDKLNAFYTSLAQELRVAASNAYFADKMSSSVSIHTDSYITKFKDTADEVTYALPAASLPKITIRTYDIVKKSDIGKTLKINGVNTTVTAEHVGERYGDPEVLETVVFNATGTEAYSSKKGGYDGPTAVTVEDVSSANNPDDESASNILSYSGDNILSDGIIYGEYFWYNTTGEAVRIDKDGNGTPEYKLEPETFCWNIGTISDKEFEMSYYVYLEGSAEGEANAGVYKTNEYATLYYTNYQGNDVNQSVASPSLAWEGAAVYYGLYLVNSNGEILTDTVGNKTGNFVDRAVLLDRTLYRTMKYNETADQRTATFDISAVNLPAEYKLYDEAAAFHIAVDSKLEKSLWTVTHGEGKTPTTYVTDYRGIEATTQNSADLTNKTGIDYTAVTVWFAVVYTPGAKPDAVVIDYGIPVDISVLQNDDFPAGATLTRIGAENDKPTMTDSQNYVTNDERPTADKFGTTFEGTYGDAQVVGDKVRYQLDTMNMPSFERLSYEAEYENPLNENVHEYYYSNVTIIPATTIYYEDNFLTFERFNDATDEPEGEWEYEGTLIENAIQAEDRPGFYNPEEFDANNVYGYDAAYSECSQYSMGRARYVDIDANSYGRVTFDFWGTGFDVISVTNNLSGVYTIHVYDDDTYAEYKTYLENGGTRPRPNVSKSVDTFYGYDRNADGEWVVSEANSPNSLYQVPVMKIENLAYKHYHVVITATYAKYYDHTNDNTDGYRLYMDAIRIYDPAGRATDANTKYINDTSTILDVYRADNEGYPIYEELRNKVIAANTFTGEVDEANGIVYIDGGYNDPENIGATMADYISYGPNNELYLEAGNAVAFTMDLSKYKDSAGNSIVASVQIGLKCETDDQPVAANVYNVGKLDSMTTLNTATDMYYDITTYATSNLPIVIKNQSTEDSILSITNLKLTFRADPTEGLKQSQSAFDGMPFGLRMTRSMADAAVMSVNEPAETPEDTIPEIIVPETTVPETTVPETTVPEETEPEETEPKNFVPEKLAVSVNKTSVKAGSNISVTVTTSGDVASISVNGASVTKYTANRKTGERTWKQNVKAEKAGEFEISVVAYNAENTASDAVVETVEVTAKNNGNSNKDKAKETVKAVVETVVQTVVKNIVSLLKNWF